MQPRPSLDDIFATTAPQPPTKAQRPSLDDIFAENAPQAKPAPAEGLDRVIGRTGRSLATGAASLADMARIVSDPVYSGAAAVADAVGAKGTGDYLRSAVTAPTFGEMAKDAFDKATDSRYAPVSKGEQYADTATEFAAALISPAVVARVGQGAGHLFQNASGKIAAMLTRGEKADAGTTRLVKALIEDGVSPDDILRATRQMKTAPVQTTLPEQASVTTGKEASKALGFQRSLTEQPSKAGTLLTQMNEQRLTENIPEAIQKVSSRNASTVSPLEAGEKLRSLASGVIDDAVKARLQAASPAYQVAVKDVLPQQTIAGLLKDPVYSAALKQVTRDPGFQRLTQGMPKNSAGYWDYVYRHVRDTSGAYSRTGENTLSKAYGDAADNLRTILDDTSKNLQMGREEFARRSPEVRSLVDGVIGKISKMKDTEKAGALIFRQPPETIQATRNVFLERDPQAWTDLVASHMADLGKGSRGLGAYLAKVDGDALIRTDIQKALTPSQYRAHRVLVQHLRAVQKGLPKGSNTVPKAQAAAELAQEGAGVRMVQAATDGRNATTRVYDGIASLVKKGAAKWQAEDHYKLAQAMVSPDVEQVGKALARLRPGSPEATQVLEQYLLRYLPQEGIAAGAGIAAQEPRLLSGQTANQ